MDLVRRHRRRRRAGREDYVHYEDLEAKQWSNRKLRGFTGCPPETDCQSGAVTAGLTNDLTDRANCQIATLRSEACRDSPTQSRSRTSHKGWHWVCSRMASTRSLPETRLRVRTEPCVGTLPARPNLPAHTEPIRRGCLLQHPVAERAPPRSTARRMEQEPEWVAGAIRVERGMGRRGVRAHARRLEWRSLVRLAGLGSEACQLLPRTREVMSSDLFHAHGGPLFTSRCACREAYDGTIGVRIQPRDRLTPRRSTIPNT